MYRLCFWRPVYILIGSLLHHSLGHNALIDRAVRQSSATRLQSVIRGHLDRKRSGTEWRCLLDPSTGCYYYVNDATGESSWTEPRRASKAAELELVARGVTRSSWAAGSTSSLYGVEDGDPISSGMTSVDNPMASWRTDPSYNKNSSHGSFQTVVEEGGEGEGGEEEAREMEQPWSLLYDDDSGCWYRYHSETGEVVWCVEDEHAAIGGGVDRVGTGSAEHGIHVDDATGNMYYVNSTTGETVWCVDDEERDMNVDGATHVIEEEEVKTTTTTKKKNKKNKKSRMVAHASSTIVQEENAFAAEVDDATIHIDPSTGNTYYVNSITGETVWCDEERDVHVDEATGNKYYVNSTTGETVWCRDDEDHVDP